MKKSILIASMIGLATTALVAAGTLWPNTSAASFAGGNADTGLGGKSTPEFAVNEFGADLKLRSLGRAYASLANKAEFNQSEFERDLFGSTLSLRTYATLDSFEVRPLHQSSTEAVLKLKMRWSSVVGVFSDERDLHLVRIGDRWAINWPIKRQERVPPQVIPVNYLRWDVIYRGSGDDWGTQDVEAPHVRIIDMHPASRAEGVVVMGELLNDDVVPAYVGVRATLVGKDGSTLDTEGAFDMISHTLLPKQVTPFIIHFPGADLQTVSSIRMEPLAVLLSASADPVVGIEDQKFQSGTNAGVVGQLMNQSGRPVNVTHVLSTFYDKGGQVIWVGGQYIDRALEPKTPVEFHVPVPQDLADKITTQRTVVATYMQGNGQ